MDFMKLDRNELDSLWAALKCGEFELNSVKGLFVHPFADTSQGVKTIYVITQQDEVYSWKKTAEPAPYQFKRFDELCGQRIWDISCGKCHGLAISESGDVFSWGSNRQGRLGVEDTTSVIVNSPMKVDFKNASSKISTIQCGWNSSYAIDEENIVYSWGQNTWGQLGDGTLKPRSYPVRIDLGIEAPHGISTILSSGAHAFALTSSGQLYGWGRNENGEVGCGIEAVKISRPASVSLPSAIKQFCASYNISLAITEDDQIWTWGGFKDGAIKIRLPTKIESDIKLGTATLIPCWDGVAILSKDESGRQLYFLTNDDEPSGLKPVANGKDCFETLMGMNPLALKIEVVPVNSNKSNALENMWKDSLFVDIRFEFPPNAATGKALKQISAHRCVLSLTSSKFYALLNNEWKELKVVLIEKYSFEVFKAMLSFIYTGQLDETYVSTVDMNELRSLAEEYQVLPLIRKINRRRREPLRYNIDPSPLFGSERFVDIYFEFVYDKDNQGNPKQIGCHRIVLSMSSEKLLNRFKTKWANRQVIPLKSYSYDIFRRFVEFLYTKTISNLSSHSLHELIQLFTIAHKLHIKELRQLCKQQIRIRVNQSSMDDLFSTFRLPCDAQIVKDIGLKEMITDRLIALIGVSTFYRIAEFAFDQGIPSLLKETARYFVANKAFLVGELKKDRYENDFAAQFLLQLCMLEELPSKRVSFAAINDERLLP